VGSCYNPFQAFAEFAAVGIDLCPAVDVCFLSVIVSVIAVLNSRDGHKHRNIYGTIRNFARTVAKR